MKGTRGRPIKTWGECLAVIRVRHPIEEVRGMVLGEDVGVVRALLEGWDGPIREDVEMFLDGLEGEKDD